MRGRLLNKHIPFTQICLVLRLVEIGPLVLEKKNFKFVNVFSQIRNYLPFEIGWGPSLEQA